MVYNYVTGTMTKEILPLRGSNFKICSDWMFDLEKAPYITIYNSNTIRRVDINTFEIKKNIDLHRLSKPEPELPRFPFINATIKSNYQWSNHKPNQPFKYPTNAYKKNPGPAKYQKYTASSRRPDAVENDNEIQEVILMPMMKLEPVPEQQQKTEETQAPKAKTKYILHQLGQITIAIPQVMDETEETADEKNEPV